MKSRDLALVAILLAIGAVLSMVIPSIGPITPDMVATFSALAILLVVPKPLAGLGIGVVAGVLGFVTTKSPFSWLNIPVHAAAGLVTAVLARLVGELLTGKFSWKPILGPLVYNIVSAGLYLTIMLAIGILPFQVYVVAWGQVMLTTVVSIIICTILYQPARAVLHRETKGVLSPAKSH